MTSRSRILPVVGPAAVLYLIVAAAVAGALDGPRLVVAAAAALLSFSPLFMRHLDAAGTRRVASVGVAASILVAAHLIPEATSRLRPAALALAMPLAGARVFQLALVVPDRPGGLLRLAPLAGALAFLSAMIGLVGTFPPVEWQESGVLLPETAMLATPRWFLWGALFGALVLRLARRRLGSGPAALASNAWGVVGLLVVVGAMPLLSWLLRVGVLRPDPVMEAVIPLGLAGVLFYGHVAMVDPRRRVYAGASMRRAVRASVALLMVVLVFSLARYAVPSLAEGSVWAWGLAAALALLVDGALKGVVRRTFAPYGGRFLDALAAATTRLDRVTELRDVGAAVLPPLREAAGEVDAHPMIYMIEPARLLTIDASGTARVHASSLSPRVVDYAYEHPGTLTLVPELEAQAVRRPELRLLVEAIGEHDTLAILPLVSEGHVEGVLFVPRGRRRSALSLEEIHAAELFARRLTSVLQSVGAQLRAQQRVGRIGAEHEVALEELDERDLRIERLRNNLEMLKSGGRVGGVELPRVAYSPAMRACEERIAALATCSKPVAVIAPHGAPTLHLAESLHRQSPVREGPFVVVDCASVPASESLVSLMGDPERGDAGWLDHAAGGTLVLRDFVALSVAAQRALHEWLGEERALADAAARTNPRTDTKADPQVSPPARLLATFGQPLEELVRWHTLDEGIAAHFTEASVFVPPLGERQADLPSLLLLAVDEACRRLGRAALGVSQPAVDYLSAQEFRGDVGELVERVRRAVLIARGPQLSLADFEQSWGPLGAGADSGDGDAEEGHLVAHGASLDTEAEPEARDPWEGTFAELERTILERAMTRAGGNKSEAARSLGLKRTTFLDKLRRHDVKSG